ncbi:hypothetical protein KQX54_009220 [Cotesia glomerata]|uniref:Uncharacterized protein n=2 Tax=Cotesia glomerata TaxID=32391 RepID=A0AAV7I3V4_COTGL|nr:hypothetical protein KQX54_009220 [Cotesia glomerata]
MTTEIREEYYHNQTCLYQSIGAIKDDNSIDLTSYLGLDVYGIRVWPANSPILEFIKVFGSCFPIESHRTAKESMKKLLICMNANSEMYQCPNPNNSFEENRYN